MNLTLFGNSFFRIHNPVKMKSYWIRVGPKFNEWCPRREQKSWRQRYRDTETQTRNEGHVTMVE